MRRFIVATAGHVDHGKSALVRALTGTDPDRLPEEKARGITIDLGFAQLALPGLDLGVVDVPGHEDFVKNMVAGVGSVDVALFVVAADDGWMPQTEEHLEILAYLGVTRAVVALTKIDLVEDEAAAIAAVRARLRPSPFEDAPIIPTSVVTHRGLDDLKDALARGLADAPPPADLGKPRLPIDRVFSLRGIGTVVTGTLTGGTLPRGQEVVVQPSGRAGHIRSVQNHRRETDTALPGTRTALNLPNLAATGDTALARGEVVTLPELAAAPASHTLDVLLIRSARELSTSHQSARPKLKDGTTVRVHHGSAHWMARVSLLNRGGLLPGAQTIARLRCDRPVFAFAGDRFIVRDGSGRRTLAGGVVLDPDAPRRAFRRATQRRFLERRAAATSDAAVAVAALLERDHAVPRAALLRKSAFSAAEIDAAVRQLTAQGTAVSAGDFLADALWWQTRRQRAADLIDTAHREHPERIGLTLGELRAALGRSLPVAVLFDSLVTHLVEKGEFIRVIASLRRATHRPRLPAHLQASGDRLRTALAAQPFEPPSRQELAPDGTSRQALRFLFDTGEALELGPRPRFARREFPAHENDHRPLAARRWTGHRQRIAPDPRHDAPRAHSVSGTSRPRRDHPSRQRSARPPLTRTFNAPPPARRGPAFCRTRPGPLRPAGCSPRSERHRCTPSCKRSCALTSSSRRAPGSWRYCGRNLC